MNASAPLCTRQLLPNDIYEITIHRATRQAVHEFFEHLTQIYEEAVRLERMPVRTLVIAPLDGPLPVIPLTSELKAWSADFGKVPSRFVILYQGAFGALVDVLVRNFGRRTSVMRVMRPKERDEAIAWLLAGT